MSSLGPFCPEQEFENIFRQVPEMRHVVILLERLGFSEIDIQLWLGCDYSLSAFFKGKYIVGGDLKLVNLYRNKTERQEHLQKIIERMCMQAGIAVTYFIEYEMGRELKE